MIKFKELLTSDAYYGEVEFPSAQVTLKNITLSVRFDSKDIVLDARYAGTKNPWYGSLCHIILGKSLNEISSLDFSDWDQNFKEDQLYWDLKKDTEEDFFYAPLESLHALIDIFRGRDYLYQEASPLVCRCFGVRESDVLDFLKTHDTATLDQLAGETKAGMGCRSCVPQLKRWLVLHEKKTFNHHYKERPIVDWLVQIDYQLNKFPNGPEWKMEIQGMKGKQVSISFEKDVTQKEEELMAMELQRFLGAAVDTGLGFFLRRARHFSNAKG